MTCNLAGERAFHVYCWHNRKKIIPNSIHLSLQMHKFIHILVGYSLNAILKILVVET